MAHEPARVGMPRIVSGVVARPELSSRLDERARLTVVRGPAGTGKSTLVASWIADSGTSSDVLWVARADEGASRPEFWASVLGELDRFGVPPAAVPRTQAETRPAVVSAFAGLERPLLLVLDNFGPPGDGWREVGEDLVAAIQATPGLNAIVIGRRPLALEDAGADLVIAGDELRLGADSARRIADDAGLDADEATLAAMLESAAGAVYSFRFAVEAALHPATSSAGDAVTARDLHERGDGTAAIPYALRGRDFDLAAELLTVHFAEFGPAEIDALSELVARIAPEDLAAHPGLALVVALLRAPVLSDRTAAHAVFVSAVEAARSRRQPRVPARHRFALAAGEAIAQRALGRPGDAVDAVRDALAAARDMSFGERASMGAAYPMLLGQAGLSAFYGLEPALAHACFNAELAASPRITLGRRRNVALANLAMIAVLGGRMRRAERLLSDIVDADWLLERTGAAPSAPYAIAAAYIAFNRGDLPAGLRVLDAHGWDRPPASENWALTAVARAVAGALRSDAPAAAEELAAANAARRNPGERAGVAVAGVETTLELLRLLTPETVIGAAREPKLEGRAAVLMLMVRALRSGLAGRTQTANEYLGRAARFASSPLQDLWIALAGTIVAHRSAGDLRAPAVRIGRVVVEHGLIWPLAILPDALRAALLVALEDSDSAGAVRAAFERIPPTIVLTPEVVEFYPRELAVLHDLVQTSSRAELAARSAVSVNTVKTQLRSLYRKLEVNDREAALARAGELGLLDGWGSA